MDTTDPRQWLQEAADEAARLVAERAGETATTNKETASPDVGLDDQPDENLHAGRREGGVVS